MCVAVAINMIVLCAPLLKKRGLGSDQIKGFTERTKMKDWNEM